LHTEKTWWAGRCMYAQGKTATGAPMQADSANGVHRASCPVHGRSRTSISLSHVNVNTQALDSQLPDYGNVNRLCLCAAMCMAEWKGVMLHVIEYFTKSLEVTRDHSNWYHSKAWVRFPIRIP